MARRHGTQPWRWLALVVKRHCLPPGHRYCAKCEAVVPTVGNYDCDTCRRRRERGRIRERVAPLGMAFRVWRTARAISGAAVLTIGKKACGVCEVRKPLTSFDRHAGRADGRETICRVCCRLRQYTWAMLDPGDRGARWLRRRQTVNQRAEERRKIRVKTDPVAHARYLARVSVSAQRRRERKTAAEGFATTEQIRQRHAFYGGLCWICQTRPGDGMDHVKPLAQGGAAWPANLRPACNRCNGSKRDLWPFSRDMIAALVAA